MRVTGEKDDARPGEVEKSFLRRPAFSIRILIAGFSYVFQCDRSGRPGARGTRAAAAAAKGNFVNIDN